MSDEDATWLLHQGVEELRRRLLDAGVASSWIQDPCRDAWRDAQSEAVAAYVCWCREPGAEGYAVYRAAQDRADAAQEVLSRRITGSSPSGHRRATNPMRRT